MARRNNHRSTVVASTVKQDEVANAYGSLALFAGIGVLLASFYLKSVMPLIIIATGLFCLMSFFGGFGS